MSGIVSVCSLAYERLPADRWPALFAVLDGEERAQANRFHFEHDRCAYVAAHALLRHRLSAVGDLAPERWRFARGDHGKPFLIAPHPLGLCFNLAHTRGMVVVAVAIGTDVGVDVECLNRRPPITADTHFTPCERAALRALPDDGARFERFLRLWTLKEAVVKATGQGLNQPLSSFAFSSVDPPRLVVFDPSLGDPAAWRVIGWRSGNHMFALAVREWREIVLDEFDV